MIFKIKSFFWRIWWINIRGFKPLKESVFGSLEEQIKINKCSHKWKPVKVIIFEYILVDARCDKCGTSKGV